MASRSDWLGRTCDVTESRPNDMRFAYSFASRSRLFAIHCSIAYTRERISVLLVVVFIVKLKSVKVAMLVEGPVDPNKLEGEESQEIRKDSAKEKSAKGARMGGETSPFAMDNRDPNNLNPHIQILWDDIIGEAEGLRTPDKCWNCSVSCYDGTRRCCYVFLVVLCAPLIAFCNGCQFACLAFNQVWCVGPCLRLWKINMATLKKFWEAWLYAVCMPMFETCGMCCSKANVKYQKVPDASTAETSSDYFNV